MALTEIDFCVKKLRSFFAFSFFLRFAGQEQTVLPPFGTDQKSLAILATAPWKDTAMSRIVFLRMWVGAEKNSPAPE